MTLRKRQRRQPSAAAAERVLCRQSVLEAGALGEGWSFSHQLNTLQCVFEIPKGAVVTDKTIDLNAPVFLTGSNLREKTVSRDGVKVTINPESLETGVFDSFR
jgi:hypothetical protein